MHDFHINYNNRQITVTPQGPDSFLVRLPDRNIELELREDNEGADHWFEKGSDNETAETAALGVAIEMVLDKESPLDN
ncbi:hypothetical protein [Chitinophaga sp. MM2321]|uniref:hypothetical protein n=1 Tax=Chitinophaga sp. MM2321 TaxID=3137178 RepID=UPI0032D5904C